MQQAIYSTLSENNTLRLQNTEVAPRTTHTRTKGPLLRLASKWDLIGVLTLMGSSAAYGMYVLAHLGL